MMTPLPSLKTRSRTRIDQPLDLSAVPLEQLINPGDLPLSQLTDKMLIAKDQIIDILATLDPSALDHLCQKYTHSNCF